MLTIRLNTKFLIEDIVFNFMLNPEVAHLQEVVGDQIDAINSSIGNIYSVLPLERPTERYFCVTLLRKDLSLQKCEVTKFENSKMLRTMTCVEVSVKY
jgi:hypothetical protein